MKSIFALINVAKLFLLSKRTLLTFTIVFIGLVVAPSAYGQYLPIFPGPVSDLSCLARLDSPLEKTRKAKVRRKAHVRLGRDLTVFFHASYFNGKNPVEAVLVIYDAETEEPIKIFSSTVTQGWRWEISEPTKFGVVDINCR